MASYMDIVLRGTDKASKVIDGVGGSLDNAATKGGKFSSILTGIGQGIGQKAFDVVSQGANQIVGFMGDSMRAASDLNETTSKVGVVFGKSADQILAWGKTSASTLGMSSNAALAAAGTYGNLFVSMGMLPQKAADMSSGLVNLAGDLASFNNTPTDQVLEALRSGLVGETEPLRQLGVNITQATVEAKAMAMGLWDGKGAIDANAKAQATYALILEQTKTAQGDFARTSSGMANQQRINAAKIENAQAKMGKVLMDVATVALPIFAAALEGAMGFLDTAAGIAAPFIKAMQDNLPGALDAVRKGLDAIIPPLVSFGQVVGGVIQTGVQYLVDNGNVLATLLGIIGGVVLVTVVPPFVAWGAATIAATLPLIAIAAAVAAFVVILNELGVLDWLAQNVLPALSSAFSFITDQVLPPLIAIIQSIVDATLPALSTAFDVAKVAIGLVFDAISTQVKVAIAIVTTQFDLLKAAIGVVMSIFEGLKTGVGAIWDGITGLVKAGINGIIGYVNILIGALDAIQLHMHFSVPNPLGGTLASANFDWNGFGIAKIKGLSTGAWNVLEGIYHLHNGEMVVPASPAQAMRSAVAGGLAGGGGGGPLVYIGTYSGGEKEDERLGRILQRRTR
jgi:phage-related protein